MIRHTTIEMARIQTTKAMETIQYLRHPVKEGKVNCFKWNATLWPKQELPEVAVEVPLDQARLPFPTSEELWIVWNKKFEKAVLLVVEVVLEIFRHLFDQEPFR